MFNNAKKERQNLDVTAPDADPANKKPAKEVKFTVHTMPKKFHATHSGASSSGGFDKPVKKDSVVSKTVLFSVIGIVVVGLGVVGFLLFKKNAGTADTVANGNTNTTMNVNTDVTINFNRNGNSNSNANTNADSNANTSANTNTASNTNTNTNTVGKGTLSLAQSSQDLDNDQLTDVEESDYGTQKTEADTDGDGYSDGVEVGFGFSPLDRGKLDASPKIGVYTNPTYGFSFLYPNDWVVDKRGTDGKGVLFISPGGDEYIEVSIQDNLGRKTPQEWYLALAPAGTTNSSLQTVQNWLKNATGVVSVDGYSTFFGSGNYIYVIYYETGSHTTLDYKTTYDMFVKSVSFTTPTPAVNTNTASNTNTNTNTNSNSNTNTNTNSTNTNLNTNDLFNVNLSTNTNVNSNSNTNTN